MYWGKDTTDYGKKVCKNSIRQDRKPNITDKKLNMLQSEIW